MDRLSTADNFTIKYSAPDYLTAVIGSLGRTEDVKFSPDNRRLAILSFVKNKITVLGIETDHIRDENIILTDYIEVYSDYLKRPHGVDFIDDEKIIVANRGGDATIFELSTSDLNRAYELAPLEVIPAGDVLVSPGAVSVSKKGHGLYEALIANNYGHQVTRHSIAVGEPCVIKSEVLLKKWINVPDGVAVNKDWIAISNHDSHNVLIYENTDSLNQSSDPVGILRGCVHPHGLRFTSDGQFMLVASGGSPYIHIYRRDKIGWKGVRKPLKSLRVLTEDAFKRGRMRHENGGGPKGIDVNNSLNVFVTTCELQPLAFFDFRRIVDSVYAACANEILPGSGFAVDEEQIALEINYELDSIPCSSQDALIHEIDKLKKSRSWRITAPIRWLASIAANIS